MATYTDGTVVQYRNELIAGFEVSTSILRDTVTKEAVIKGGQAVFLVVNTGGATAVTRGPTGEIPARAQPRTPYTVTLQEAHDVVEETGFVDFISQGDLRRARQAGTMAVINRDIDEVILTELATASVTDGGSGALTVARVLAARAKLSQAAVPIRYGDVYGVLTPAAMSQLLRYQQFTSSDYVDSKPYTQGTTGVRDQFLRWMGILWTEHPNIPGAGTATTNNFIYSKAAIGHAADSAGIKTALGYDERHDLTFARATLYHGAKLLQNAGVVKLPHDDTAAFA